MLKTICKFGEKLNSPTVDPGEGKTYEYNLKVINPYGGETIVKNKQNINHINTKVNFLNVYYIVTQMFNKKTNKKIYTFCSTIL